MVRIEIPDTQWVTSPVSLNSAFPSRVPSPHPSPPTASVDRHASFEHIVKGLLIPTDRTREDLEEKWLPKLGKLRVEREIVLSGYSLYSLRPW